MCTVLVLPAASGISYIILTSVVAVVLHHFQAHNAFLLFCALDFITKLFIAFVDITHSYPKSNVP